MILQIFQSPSFWMKYTLANHCMPHAPLILFSKILMPVLRYPHEDTFHDKTSLGIVLIKRKACCGGEPALLRHLARVSSELRLF